MRDAPDSNADAQRLRYIRAIADVDEETLRVIGGVIERVASAPERPARKRGPRGERNRQIADKEQTP
jgi:hypothetical protein